MVQAWVGVGARLVRGGPGNLVEVELVRVRVRVRVRV